MAFDTIINKQELEGAITATANAIRAKTGDSAPIQWLTDKGFADAVSAIQAGSSGGGGGSVGQNDVMFYDYDGTILHSFTADEALALTALPDLPTRDGLICQGWNWSLEDMKTYVSDYGKCNIGAMYITDDGKTRIYIKIPVEGRMTVPLYFNQSVSDGVVISWGDGSPTETLSGTGKVNTTHEYSNIGEYVITLEVLSGCTLKIDSCIMDSGNWVYTTMIQKIEIGANVTSITGLSTGSAFQNCHSLTSITIPDGVTYIGSYAFYGCTVLTSIVIPDSVTSIANYAFQNCHSLTSITIPDAVTSIGNYAFYGCTVLTDIVIPDGITSIGNYTFQNCNSLRSITIPDGVRSIGGSAFKNCLSLTSIVISGGVTSIGDYAFQNCQFAVYYDFSSHTAVPTLANTNAFTSIPADCEIRVPAALYDEWIAATNWSTYASNIVAV